MTHSSLFSFSILCLATACQGTAQIDDSALGEADLPGPEFDSSSVTDTPAHSSMETEVRFDIPVQEMFCSTQAWQGEHAASEVLRFHFERWEAGNITIELEDGFAHPDVAESMGLEATLRRYTDADITWEDGFLDAYFGDNGVWLYPHWSDIDGLWEGYIYDTEFSGGDVLNCGGFMLHCWEPEVEARFSYDPATGVCTDENGEVGLNPWSLPMVRETGDGQCADLRWQELNESEYSYADLEDWDLRGADLDFARMHFTNLVQAQLEGANLENFEYGYAEITGTVDDFTTLPQDGCGLFEDHLICEF